MILIALKMNGQDIDWERKNCSGHWLHLSTAQRTRRCTSMRELKSAEQTCVKRSTESSIPHFCSISLSYIRYRRPGLWGCHVLTKRRSTNYRSRSCFSNWRSSFICLSISSSIKVRRFVRGGGASFTFSKIHAPNHNYILQGEYSALTYPSISSITNMTFPSDRYGRKTFWYHQIDG